MFKRRPYVLVVLGLAIVTVSTLGLLYLPRGFQEVHRLDSSYWVKWTSNPLWDAMFPTLLLGMILFSIGLCRINAYRTLIASAIIVFMAFSPAIFPPPHGVDVDSWTARQIQEEFERHIDAPWLIVVRINWLEGEYPDYRGEMELYTFFYLKYGEYKQSRGLILNPLTWMFMVPAALISYTSIITTITSMGYLATSIIIGKIRASSSFLGDP